MRRLDQHGKGAPIDTPIELERIDPELIERFAEAINRLWPANDRTGALGLAVSGGPDSLALLLLGAVAMPGEIAAMSIDHGLRAEAAGEVALVESVCRTLKVPFFPAEVSVGAGNLQSKARHARYAALADWAEKKHLGAVATAHHIDDQAETLLLRLVRGSGLAGLAGVREWTTLPGTTTPLMRPLLRFRKNELEEVVAAAGVEPARDPSNANPAFDRVRVRQHLSENDWLDAEALATSSHHIAEGWRALEWYADIDWEEMVSREDTSDGSLQYRYYCNVPRAIQVETVRRIIGELGGQVSRNEAGMAADRLWRGQNASLGGVLAKADVENVETVGVEMRVWRFSPEPPRRTH